MGALGQFLENPVSLIASFFIVLMAIKELFELSRYWKGRADDYHMARSEREGFQKKVSDIASTSERHADALVRIGKAIDSINDTLNKAEEDRKRDLAEMETRLNVKIAEIEENRKQDLMATGRILIYQFYEKLKDKPEVTAGELEAFNAIADRFIAAGGNGVFKGKIIPEIRAKAVEGR